MFNYRRHIVRTQAIKLFFYGYHTRHTGNIKRLIVKLYRLAVKGRLIDWVIRAIVDRVRQDKRGTPPPMHTSEGDDIYYTVLLISTQF